VRQVSSAMRGLSDVTTLSAGIAARAQRFAVVASTYVNGRMHPALPDVCSAELRSAERALV
jgi:hypothetical protein